MEKTNWNCTSYSIPDKSKWIGVLKVKHKLNITELLVLHECVRGIAMTQNLESVREKINELSYIEKKKEHHEGGQKA